MYGDSLEFYVHFNLPTRQNKQQQKKVPFNSFRLNSQTLGCHKINRIKSGNHLMEAYTKNTTSKAQLSAFFIWIFTLQI